VESARTRSQGWGPDCHAEVTVAFQIGALFLLTFCTDEETDWTETSQNPINIDNLFNLSITSVNIPSGSSLTNGLYMDVTVSLWTFGLSKGRKKRYGGH